MFCGIFNKDYHSLYIKSVSRWSALGSLLPMTSAVQWLWVIHILFSIVMLLNNLSYIFFLKTPVHLFHSCLKSSSLCFHFTFLLPLTIHCFIHYPLPLSCMCWFSHLSLIIALKEWALIALTCHCWGWLCSLASSHGWPNRDWGRVQHPLPAGLYDRLSWSHCSWSSAKQV